MFGVSVSELTQDLFQIYPYGMESRTLKLNDTQLLALSKGLRSIDLSKGKKSAFDQEFWFQGDENYFNIFLGLKSGAVSWMQITFRGLYVELKDSSFSTGKTNDYEIATNQFPSSKKILPDAQINFELVQTMIALLEKRSTNEVLGSAFLTLKNAFTKFNSKI